MNLEERNENNKSFFKGKADVYDEVHKVLMNTKKEAISKLEDKPLKVLDLGAGTGLELIYLFEKYPDVKVTAIDITEEMLNKIKERPFADKVELVCGDFFKVSFGSEYDAVISTSALHHFTKEDKLILYKKIYECLKEGKYFISADRYVDTLLEEEKFMNYFKENFHKEAHCDTPLCVDTEKEILELAGFRNISFTNSEYSKDYKILKCQK